MQRGDSVGLFGVGGHEAEEGRAGDQRVFDDIRPGGEINQRGADKQDRGEERRLISAEY